MGRLIVAGSSGFRMEGGRVSVGPVVREAIARSRRPDRARFCFLGTAGEDDPAEEDAVRSAFDDTAVQFSAVRMTGRVDPGEVRRQLRGQDVIWADGGSGQLLLDVWHRLELERTFRDLWDDGTVLAGISAGAICWHVGGTPDWNEPRARAILDGLGLLPYGAGVHYQDGRRAVLHALVADGTLPVSYATDDGVALVYEGTEVAEAVADRPDANAYRVARAPDGSVVESVITPRLLPASP